MILRRLIFIGLITMVFSGCSSDNYSPVCTEEILLDESALIILIDNFKKAGDKFNLKYSGYNSKFPSGRVVTVSELTLKEEPVFSFVNLKIEGKYLFSVYEFKDKNLKSKILDVLTYGLKEKFRKCGT
jgi:hypothetical protein